MVFKNKNMNKIYSFIKSKKYILLTLIFLVLIAAVVNYINTSKQKAAISEPSKPAGTDQKAGFGEIFPGQTTSDRVNDLLGFPVSSTVSGEITTSDFKSSNQYRTHQVELINGGVVFVKEVVNPGDSRSSEDIRKTYGDAPQVLFEKSQQSPFLLYVYPNNGLAYIGHQDGTMLEIWYFVPTTIEDFMSKWAKDYSKEPSKNLPIY